MVFGDCTRLMFRHNMVVWPERLHWGIHSDQKHQRRISQMNTNRSIEDGFPGSDNDGINLLMNTSINKLDFRSKILDSEEDKSGQKSKKGSSQKKRTASSKKKPQKRKRSLVKKGRVGSRMNTSADRSIANIKPKRHVEKVEPRPVYMITVNRKNQMVYTLMFENSREMEGVPVGTSEVVHQFDEMITVLQHIPGLDALLVCGSPTLYIWYVKERVMAFEYQLKMVLEPWFTIWDCLILNKKGCIILGLSTGNVIQLNFDQLTLHFEEKRIFQSNEEGLGVYSLAYFPKHDLVLAANGSNLITEFNFKFPKNLPSKKIFYNRSTRNISNTKRKLNSQGQALSIRHISKHSAKRNIVFKTMSYLQGNSSSLKNRY